MRQAVSNGAGKKYVVLCPMYRSVVSILIVLLLISAEDSEAQYLRAKLGTDIPLQYAFGLNYQQGKFFSGEVGFGYVGYPYNGDLYKVINVPEKFQARKEFLMETTDDGWVFNIGVNGHYKRWYGGVFAQQITLNASATYEYIVGSELFQEELTNDQRNILNAFLSEDLEQVINNQNVANVNLQDQMFTQSVIWQMGGKIGRRFMFRNPRWEFRAELALSANISANTTADYDKELFDGIIDQYNGIVFIKENFPDFIAPYEDALGFEIPTDLQLETVFNFEERADDVDELFKKYAYIPTLNLHVTYLLWVPKKVKEQQRILDEERANP
jgi:hypothetical protein